MRTTLPEFETAIRALCEAGVRFVLVGGLAMRAHGSSYVTDDLDIGYCRDLTNLQALADALAPLHPRLRGAPADLPFRLDLRTLRAGQNFTLVTDPVDLDLLGELAGVHSFDELWQRGVEKELFGFVVRVASIEDLISMKRAAGRAKDLAHIAELQALSRLIAEECAEDR